jgi:hypothetical protein
MICAHAGEIGFAYGAIAGMVARNFGVHLGG